MANLTPNDTTFDLETTARAYALNPASLPPDLSEPPPSGGGGGGGGGDGSGGGGGGGGGAPPAPTVDWTAAFFGSLGLPPDVAARVNQIFSQYSDTNAATAAATAYIRGTPWYAQTYPGIKEGMAKGIVRDEGDYRALLNQQTQLYKQYLGRDITSGEFAANLGEGASNQIIGGRLQGAALAGTYGHDWRYLLGSFDTGQPNAAELKALGEEQAGLDSPLGQQVQRRLDLAKQRMQTVFQGTYARPSLSRSGGRVFAPGLGGNGLDIGA